MCSFSTYCQTNILNHIFGKSNYSSPNVYIGLLTCEPNEDGTSTLEPEGSGYARILTNISDWDNAFEGIIENVHNITFAMACENWGRITYFALFDAVSGGNILAYGTLSPSKIINSGDIPRFAPGDLIVSLE